MTRKSLAIGSGLALLATGFAAPAQAASAIEITAANSKSVYGMLEGEAFSFTIAGNADFNAGQQGLLRVEVVNVSGGAAASAISINGTALIAANDISLLGGGSTAVAMDADAGDPAVFGLGDGAASLMTTPFTFSFISTATALKAQAYAVTAFVDVNNDGIRQAGELASPTRTVTWYDSSKVEVNIAIDGPTAGDTATGADITSTQIALDQLTVAEIGVEYFLGTGAAITTAPATYTDAVARNAVNPAILESDLAVINALTAVDAVKAQLVHKDTAVDVVNPHAAANTNVGAPATLAVAATSVNSITGSVVDSATGQTAASALQVLNEGTWSAAAKVVSTATGNPALAGQAVTAKIVTSRALSATETLTVGGVTYTASATLPGATGVAKLAVGTSDADGMVYLPIATDGMTDADTVTVTFYTSNKSGAVTAVLKDAVYAGYLENVNGVAVTTTDGTATTLDVVVLDQFGGTAPAGYKARAVFDAAATTAQATLGATAASGSEVALVNGRGSLSILDNGTGLGTNVYDIGFNTGVAGAVDTPIVANLNVKIVKSENTVTGAFTLVDDAAAALALNTAETGYLMTAGKRGASDTKLPIQNMNGAVKRVFKNFDARSELGGLAPNVAADAITDRATITGVVSSSFSNTVAQAVLPNATITFSGAGLQFQSTENGSAVWGEGSLTIQASAAGAFSVNVYSQKAGVNTVTITSGSVSKTVFLYTDAAATDTATSLTVEAPVSIMPGRTLAITGLLTDRFGNPRTSAGTDPFKVTYSGPGYPGTLPAVTGADGTFSFNVLLGANDSGSATITAYYDIDGDSLYTSVGDLVVTKTVIIGTVAADTKVNAGSFKGYVAVYAKGHMGKRLSAKVGNDWVVVPALASNFVRVVGYTGAGYTIAVRIYIDRVLVDTITVTTK